jgi:hypothetical protein
VQLADPDSGETLELSPVMCPTCEVLVFPWAAAIADEDVDLEDDAFRLRGLGQHWVADELKRIYGAGGASPSACWWCGSEGRVLSLEVRSNGETAFANPVLCFACQGLMHMVGGGFSTQDDAEREAQKEAEERIIAAYRGS